MHALRPKHKTLLTNDLGQRLETKLLRLRIRGENDGRGTVVDAGCVGGGDGAVLEEDGLEGRHLVEDDLLVLLILLDDGLALPVLDGDGCKLGVEGTSGPSLGGAFVRFDGMRVLVLTGNVVLLGRVLSTVAHRNLVVDVRETIRDERVLCRCVAEGGVGAGKEERSIAHALHATGSNNRALTELDALCCERDGLHTTGADLVNSRRLGRMRQSCEDRGLACGCLTNTSLNDVAEENLLDRVGRNAGGLECMLECNSTELRGRERLEDTVQRADGRARRADNNHIIGSELRL